MRDMQAKLDAVPDVYEDRTHDMFEQSNRSSQSQTDDMQEPYYGYVKRGGGNRTKADGGDQIDPGDEHQKIDPKMLLHRMQMQEIYQQKLKVTKKIKRKLSPIKMDKKALEAHRF